MAHPQGNCVFVRVSEVIELFFTDYLFIYLFMYIVYKYTTYKNWYLASELDSKF